MRAARSSAPARRRRSCACRRRTPGARCAIAATARRLPMRRSPRCATPAHGAGQRAAGPQAIEIRGAREHNLKNIDVSLARNQFTVITGVSGSGKSTLAFDIVFAEGQRRYLESLNAYARQFVQPASRPDVDAIFGIPPTVAIEQRTSRGGRKSTVATLTEIYHFLRLLYVKLGVQYCPACDVADRAAIGRRDCRAAAQGLSRAGSITLAGAAHRRAQGTVYGARQMGARQGLRAAARRRQACCPRRNGRGSTASSSTTSNCPWHRSR